MYRFADRPTSIQSGPEWAPEQRGETVTPGDQSSSLQPSHLDDWLSRSVVTSNASLGCHHFSICLFKTMDFPLRSPHPLGSEWERGLNFLPERRKNYFSWERKSLITKKFLSKNTDSHTTQRTPAKSHGDALKTRLPFQTVPFLGPPRKAHNEKPLSTRSSCFLLPG